MSLLRMGRVEFACLKSTIETRKSEIYSELATKLKKKTTSLTSFWCLYC